MKLKIYLLTFMLLNSIAAYGQMPGWEWADRAGSVYGDVVSEDMVTDLNGNVYVTGYYWGSVYFGSVYCASVGSSNDFFLAKYDASGNVLWAKHAGGNHIDEGWALTLDHNGDVYVTGIFASNSIAFDTLTINCYSDGYYDMFTVKYNASGDAIWAKSVTGINDQRGFSICADSKKNVYAHGTSQLSSITLDSLTLSAQDFLVKYDSIGNRIWVKVPSTGGTDNWLVKTDTDDNLYFAGTFWTSTLTFDDSTLYSTQYPFAGATTFLIKYDSANNILWAKTSGGGGYALCDAIALDDNNDIYINGGYDLSGGSVLFDSLSLPGDKQMFLIKYDPSGNMLWATTDEPYGNGNFSRTMVSDANENIYITGTFGTDSIMFGDIKLVNSATYSSDFYLLKYDGSGSLVWVQNIEAQYQFSELPVLAMDNSGHLCFGGPFEAASMNFGNISLSNYAAYNTTLFLAKMNDTLSCSADFTVYPDTSMPHHYWVISNASGVDPVTYSWSWGDGTYSTIQYPSHTYAAAGFYDICLTTGDATGCSSNYCNTYNLQKLSDAEAENTMVTINVVTNIPTAVVNPNVLQSWSVFPNPASGNSFINYTLSTAATVSIDLYDVLGNKLQQLVNGDQQQGEHNTTLDAHKLASGVYLLQIRAGDQMAEQKIVLLR